MSVKAEILAGIFPSPVVIKTPDPRVENVGCIMDIRNIQFRAHALPSDNSSKDRGLQLQVGTSRTRRGNKRSR